MDGVFNTSKGKIHTLAANAAGDVAASAFVVLLLSAAEVDDTLNNYDTLDVLLAAAGNTEATFTNYARKTVADANITITVDDTNNRVDVDIPDQTWAAAGGATNNTLVKLLVCYDADTAAGTDANIVPVAYFDFAATTDGSDLTAQIAAAGLLRAA